MAKITKLSNGLKIVTDTNKNVDTVICAIGVKVGNRQEHKSETGLSHALEHMLFKGTTNRTGEVLNEVVDFVGANTNAYTSNEQTVYYIKGPKEHAELALDVLIDQTQNSIFPTDPMAKEMEVIEQEIKRSFDNPGDNLYHNFTKIAFKGNPLALPILGSVEQVLAYTPADMMAYYKKHYHPANMVVSVAGNIKHSDVVVHVKKYFPETTTKFKKTKTPTLKWHGGESLVHKADENQVSVMVAWPVIGRAASTIKDEAIAYVVNSVMSGGMSSKLFKEIREKRGLVYSVSSSIDTYEELGYFEISGGTDHKKVGEFLEATALVLNTFEQDLVENDLIKAKNGIKASLASSRESINNVAMRNIRHIQQYGKLRDNAPLVAAINEVTIKDVVAFVRETVKGEPVLSIYGFCPQLETGDISLEKFKAMLK